MKMLNNKIKGILTLIASVLIHLLIGNLFSFPNFIPYYKSYLYYKNNNTEVISLLQLYFIAPVGIFVHNTLPSVTGFLDQILGTRILAIIGLTSLLGSQLLLYFFIDYSLLILSYVLFGLCGSLTYFQTLKNCWKYFPNKKGLISGIIFSSFGLSSFAFTSLGDLIINPNSKEKEPNGFYSEEISNKFLDYIKFYIICIIIMGTISSILCFPYENEKSDFEENEKIDITKEITLQENENHSDENKQEDNNNEIIENDHMSLKKSLLSLEFYKCLSIAGCTLIFGFLLSNTYRNFGIEMNLSDLGMQILSKAFTLLNTFSRLIWGLICDKFGFKIPYIIICINQILCGSLIYFASNNIYTYFTVVCFGVLSYAGHIILFPNLIHNKFGVDNSVIILGICGIFGGIACILGPILTFFIIKEQSDYLKIYLIGAFPTIFSLFLTFFVKIEKKDNKTLIPITEETNEIINDRNTNDTTPV